MEIVLPQAASLPQCDTSPQRLPAVSTGLNAPGAPHAESQSMEREGGFPLKASLDVCTSPEPGTTILLQADKGRDRRRRNNYCTSRRSRRVCKTAEKNRQQQRVVSWGAEQAKQFDPLEGNGKAVTFPSRRMSVSCTVCPYAFPMFFLVFFCFSSCLQTFLKQVRELRRFFNQGWERLG